MHPEKLKTLSAMRPQDRAEYALERICAFEQLWSIGPKQDVCLIDDLDNGVSVVYVWPDKALADAFTPEAHKGAQTLAFSLETFDFLDRFIPKMKAKEIRFSVFYAGDNKSWIYSADDLKEFLEHNLPEYS